MKGKKLEFEKVVESEFKLSKILLMLITSTLICFISSVAHFYQPFSKILINVIFSVSFFMFLFSILGLVLYFKSRKVYWRRRNGRR